MATVDFEFGLGDAVMVKALELPGRVDSLSAASDGMTYRVVYWCNGERKAEWLYGWEIGAMGVEKPSDGGMEAEPGLEIVPGRVSVSPKDVVCERCGGELEWCIEGERGGKNEMRVDPCGCAEHVAEAAEPLKPCPFCGSDEVRETYWRTCGERSFWSGRVRCDRCDFGGPQVSRLSLEERDCTIRAAWNRRAGL